MDKRNFYVSVIDGARKGLLAGPYPTHQEALDMADKAREMAYKVDVWAVFYAFGTCRTPPGYSKPGVLNDLLKADALTQCRDTVEALERIVK